MDGENPNLNPDIDYVADSESPLYRNWRAYDIEGVLSNFTRLRVLEIRGAPLNGRYPFLFNSFPLLEKLTICGCDDLDWNLEMLAGMPLLKELHCECSLRYSLSGNINSLRVLKDTLEKVLFAMAI